jgi:hypothetical protein
MSQIVITIQRDADDADADCTSGKMTVEVKPNKGDTSKDDDPTGSLEAGTVEPKRGKHDLKKGAGEKDYPIPAGEYDADVKKNSGKNPTVKGHNNEAVELKDVKGFTDILIHVGNFAKNTEGCILIGTRDDKKPCTVAKSVDKNKELLDLIQKVKDANAKQKEKTTIKVIIEDPEKKK